jgi:hypothetical protein
MRWTHDVASRRRVLGRRDVADRFVQPPKVDAVDVLERGDLDLSGPAPRAVSADQLGLVEADRRLGHGVVKRVPDRPDGGSDSMLRWVLGVDHRGVLGTGVAVMHERARSPSTPCRRLQSLGGERGSKVGADRPADDHAGPRTSVAPVPVASDVQWPQQVRGLRRPPGRERASRTA